MTDGFGELDRTGKCRNEQNIRAYNKKVN